MKKHTQTTVELATEITIAWLNNPTTFATAETVTTFLNTVADAITTLEAGSAITESVPDETYTPAVSVRQSLAKQPHYLISMIDGKAYKTLRRHLSTNGLTAEQYRERYGLKPDYPMVATAYSESRRDMAKKIGLGRKPGHKVNKS